MKLILKPLIPVLSLLFSVSLMAQSGDLKRANKQYELSDFANAVKSYKEVLEKQSAHLEANSKLADCYRHLNQLDMALPHYQMAVSQSGVSDMYVFQYGLTLQELGRYDLAQKVFEKLAENSPDFRTRAKQFADACQYARNNDEPPLFKVTNEYLNKPSADFGVALFKDERVVYSSSRSDIQSRNSRNASSAADGSNQLFITQRDKNGFLETPVTLHSGFGTSTNEGPVSYSPDGKWVAITKNSFVEGVRQIPSSGQEMTLYIAQVDDNGDWTNAVPFPHNGIGFSTGYPAFSQDGNVLYFASSRNGGYGGYDLYASYRTGSTWSTPENLGAAINSIGNEITPFHDGTSLYFASDYQRGFGGFDIFRAEESNAKWATIYHGGPGLNSSSDDFGFVFDPLRNTGYFVSNRAGGKGNEDIYRVVKETENVVIKVTDAATGKPVADATVDFSDCGDKSYQTNANGVFNFQVMENLNCSINVGKTGYIGKSVKITSLGLRQSRNVEVSLTNENTAYKGKTVNGSNGYVLEEVKVIASNQKTGDVIETTSSSRGDYMISLQPNSSYVIRYSKAGFTDFSFNFPTTANDVKAIQNVDLLPVGVTASGKQIEKPASPKEIPASSSSASSTSTAISSGYAVQIAAVNSSNVELAPYVSKIGIDATVYSVQESGKTKIRAGVFSNRADAEQAQKKIRANGYPGAFIVEESNRQVLSALQPQTSAKKIDTPAAPPATPAASTANTAASSKLEGYMVRLATYSDLKNFDSSKIQDVGVITRVPKGKMTIVLLSGFDSQSSAEIALQKAKVRGFPDAYLVMEEKGEIKKAN